MQPIQGYPQGSGMQPPAMGPRVFICHAQADDNRLRQLLAALSSWDVQYFHDTQVLAAGMPLSGATQQAIVECTVFLRVCSVESQQSYWVGLEQGAFLSLQAEDFRTGNPHARMLVNLIIDEKYVRQPFDSGALNVVAFKRPDVQWVNELRSLLGLAPLPPQDIQPITFMPPGKEQTSGQRVSRRSVLAATVAGTSILAAAGAFGLVLSSRRGGSGPTVLSTKASGDVLWKQQVGNRIVASPAVVNGMIYVGALDNILYAFSTDGKLKWSYPATGNAKGNGIYVKPAVADGIVYIYGNDDYISALDANSGAVRWTTAPPSGAGNGTVGYASPVVVNGVLYVGSYVDQPGSVPGVLKGLEAATGKELPGEALNTFVSSTPRVVGDVLYAAPFTIFDYNSDTPYLDGYLYALDIKNGLAELWKTHIGEVDYSSPAIADGVAYLCTTAPDTSQPNTNVAPDNPAKDQGYLQAVDLATHAVRWRFGAGKSLYSSPLVANGLVYFGADDHNVYAVQAETGQKKWSYATGGAILGSPVLAGGVLYIGSADNSIHALDPQSGTLVRKYMVGGGITGTPVVQDGVLYIGAKDKYMYAFKV